MLVAASMPALPAATLAELLAESGIRWKVVLVSACYSGGFIPPLADEQTLVMTAARADGRERGGALLHQKLSGARGGGAVGGGGARTAGGGGAGAPVD